MKPLAKLPLPAHGQDFQTAYRKVLGVSDDEGADRTEIKPATAQVLNLIIVRAKGLIANSIEGDNQLPLLAFAKAEKRLNCLPEDAIAPRFHAAFVPRLRARAFLARDAFSERRRRSAASRTMVCQPGSSATSRQRMNRIKVLRSFGLSARMSSLMASSFMW